MEVTVTSASIHIAVAAKVAAKERPSELAVCRVFSIFMEHNPFIATILWGEGEVDDQIDQKERAAEQAAMAGKGC